MSKRTKWLLGIGVIAALVIGWQVAAFAVHNTGAFELDGNATSGAAAGDDWDSICKKVTITNDPNPPNNIPDQCASAPNPSSTNTAAAFVTDGSGSNTIFTGGGSKDPIDINQWAFKNSGGLPDKDNLVHGMAARYSLPASTSCPVGGTPTVPTCELLYFGSDRFANDGDAQQGFWFFQNKVDLGTNSIGGGTGFTGQHKNGDVLIISDFSNGGDVSTIKVYKWDAPATNNTGCIQGNIVNNPQPGDCADLNLRLIESSESANCADLPSGPTDADDQCGIVNPNTIIQPWTFVDKTPTSTDFPADSALNGEFFEGGVNLNALGLADRCFASVASESRASTSTVATLKDFVLGTFGNCGSTTTTTPKDNAGNNIPVGGLSIGTGKVQVKDSALVAVPGSSTTIWHGTVSFFLCKVDSPGLCNTGGTTVNDGATAVPVDNDPATATTTPTALSSAATVTSAGRYCWRAVFSGDPAASVGGSSDSTATECFTVNPVTPTLATTAGDDVTLGNPVTDTATLSGTATQPTNPVINLTNTGGAAAGGTITFKLYGPSDTGCGTLRFTSDPVTVSGDRNANTTPSSYGPVSFTPTAAMGPGEYHWVADYSGNSPNTNAASDNTACDDPDEDVVVNQLNSTVSSAQDWLPNDTATLNHGGPSGYLVTFTLIKNAEVTDSQHCSVGNNGTQIYTADRPVTGTGTAQDPFTASTNNTTNKVTSVTAGDKYTWKIEVPATGAFKAVTSCEEATTFTSLDNGDGETSSP